jgi:hypothetical protein
VGPAGLDTFRTETEAFELERLTLAAAPLAHARAAVEVCGLLLLGETHGVREVPSVVYTLVCELGVRGLALEWSHEEADTVVQQLLSTGTLDLDALWTLPPSAELFSGDGRVTAGHFALLQRLRDEERLEQVVLFDRVGPEPGAPGSLQLRERRLAERLLAEWRRDVPLVAVAGAGHVTTSRPDGATMATHVTRAVPAVGRATVEFESGRCWWFGPKELRLSPFASDESFVLPKGSPATVPAPGAAATGS